MTAAPLRTHRPASDYVLAGKSSCRAVEAGLAAAEWYHTDVFRKEMKALMSRTDGPALRDTSGRTNQLSR